MDNRQFSGEISAEELASEMALLDRLDHLYEPENEGEDPIELLTRLMSGLIENYVD